MKVIFLGTSYGAPSHGRRQQSLLLETADGSAYLIDAGGGVLDSLVEMNYPLPNIKTIFITHLHGDHMNGLPDILNLCGYFNMNFTVYLSEQRGIDTFTAYDSMQRGGSDNPRVKYKLIKEGCFYDDGTLKLTAYPTAHIEGAGKPSYGFLAEADSKSVYITGDLHPSMKDIPSDFGVLHTDMIITECAHFDARTLYARLAKCNAESAAVIHVMPPSKYADLKTYADDLPYKLHLPDDGDSIEL